MSEMANMAFHNASNYSKLNYIQASCFANYFKSCYFDLSLRFLSNINLKIISRIFSNHFFQLNIRV